MNIKFEELPRYTKEELIKIVEYLKRVSEEQCLEIKLIKESFMEYKTSICKSLDKLQNDIRKEYRDRKFKFNKTEEFFKR